jgi:hypothetical protein
MADILQAVNGISSQLGQEVSSAFGAVSGLVPSGLVAGLTLLLVLPVIGVFARPLLRLGGAITHTTSAIIVAVLVCISAWIVLVIDHLTDMTAALRPGAKTRPVLLAVMLSGLVVLVAYAFQRSEKGLNSCVVNGQVQGGCLARHNAVRF